MYCTVVVVGPGAEVIVAVAVVAVDAGAIVAVPEVAVAGDGAPTVQTWFVFPAAHAYVCGAPLPPARSRHCVPPVRAMRASGV
jgi:hypothetical protein